MATWKRDVTVVEVTRLPHSKNGNPVKVLHTAAGEKFRTAPDAGVAYAISDNWGYGSKVLHLLLNGRNHIIDIEETS